ncbi:MULTISPECIES: hypothetical protein [Bartonella]|uniref:hypothetical protein n=1 Tax=Bartonella TaxID=773 RepID=UPI0018DD7BFD|nr:MULTISPECIES: hypothetical protein [Bartonella]MBH9975761.1 hypothetical protein [Bartonella choladocola]MBI0015368.1 hypothetical protein [Bartonella sp. B10834G3]
MSHSVVQTVIQTVVQAVVQAVIQAVIQAVVQAVTQNKAYLSNVQDKKKYIILSFSSGAFSSGAFSSGAFSSGKCCFPNYHFKNKKYYKYNL